ncbi:hypothetical protein ACFQEP_02590 [Lactococcus lactis subsp. hordniae]
MFRITIGRVSGYTYQSVFGEVNENKAFKYVEKVHGKRVYGRGYVAVNGLPAKEFLLLCYLILKIITFMMISSNCLELRILNSQ